MVWPASVSSSPRPDLRSSSHPVCISSFLSWALTAEVERPSRSAACAKLPSATPVAKLRSTSRSRFVTDMATILFFKTI